MSKINKTACCVYGCMQTKRTNPDCPFFSLPTDRNRCTQWLEIIGRHDLLERGDIRPKSYSVCSLHFEERMFKTVKLLANDAVPCKHLPDSTSNVTTSTETTRNNHTQILTTASSSVDWEDIIIKSEAMITTPPHEAKPIKHEAEETDSVPATLIIPGLQDDFSKSFCKFKEAHANIQKNIDKDSKEYKFYALNMYLLNPQVYSFVKDSLNLPSERVVKNIKLKLTPALDNRVLDCLASKLKSFPDKAKYCTVCVDTVQLKRHLYYDILNDEVVGFQDVNGNKNRECAEYAYVMMLRGLQVKWDQPVAYCLLSNGKDVYELGDWIDKTIEHLFKIGFEVMALVTDQGCKLRKYAQEVKLISPDRTYFEVNGKKVYYIYEARQLLKCFWNKLMTHDICYSDEVASWEHIKALYNLESKKKQSLILKTSSSHINPNDYERGSVAFCEAIFSKTVSDAIHTHVDMGTLPKKAIHTANFCLILNNLYDVLNSKTYKNENINKCAFGTHESQISVIVDALHVFGTLRVRSAANENTRRMGSASKMHVTLLSILSLTKDLNDLGYKYILTERLNLGALEEFTEVCKRMVYEKNSSFSLTPVEFCRNFSKLFIRYILKKSPLSNRLRAFDKYFEEVAQLSVNRLNRTPTKKSQVSLNGDIEYRITLPDDCPAIYVASYLFYKCEKAHNCVKLKKYAKTLPELTKAKAYDKINQKAKFYGKLKLLDLPFVNYIQQLEKALLQNFHSAMCLKLGADLLRVLKNVRYDPPCRCFPTSYLITVLIRLRIYSMIKRCNKSFKTSNRTVSDFLSQLFGN